MAGSPYQGDDAKVRRVEDVIGRLESLNGAQAAGASNLIPLDGGGDVGRVEVDGVAVDPGASRGCSSPASPPTTSRRLASR